MLLESNCCCCCCCFAACCPLLHRRETNQMCLCSVKMYEFAERERGDEREGRIAPQTAALSLSPSSPPLLFCVVYFCVSPCPHLQSKKSLIRFSLSLAHPSPRAVWGIKLPNQNKTKVLRARPRAPPPPSTLHYTNQIPPLPLSPLNKVNRPPLAHDQPLLLLLPSSFLPTPRPLYTVHQAAHRHTHSHHTITSVVAPPPSPPSLLPLFRGSGSGSRRRRRGSRVMSMLAARGPRPVPLQEARRGGNKVVDVGRLPRARELHLLPHVARQLLPQLHSPLVERVYVPDKALHACMQWWGWDVCGGVGG